MRWLLGLLLLVLVAALLMGRPSEHFVRGGGKSKHKQHKGRRHNRVQHSRYEEVDRDDTGCSISGCPDGYLCYVYEDGSDTCIFTT